MTDTDEPRGERLIQVTREALANWLTDTPAYETNVPEDVALVELWHHPKGWGYVLRVSSSEWEPLMQGEPIPEFEATVEEESG